MANSTRSEHAANAHTEHVARQLVGGDLVDQLPYAAVSLTNESAGLINLQDSTPQSDPNLLYCTRHLAVYWGETGHPLRPPGEHVWEMLDFADRPDRGLESDIADMLDVRAVILGASVGEVALAESSTMNRELADEFDGRAAGLSIAQAMAIARQQRGAPVAAVQIVHIVRSRVAPVNSRVALLRYPPPGEPSALLSAVQNAIQFAHQEPNR